MKAFGERLFAFLVRAYPREFRERYGEDLLAFFREDRRHPRYGTGPLRPIRFWTATLRDLLRAAAAERFVRRTAPAGGRGPMRAISGLAFDLRYAVRSLLSTRAVSLTAVLVLALGIGAGTAIFAVVDGVVLRDLGFADEAALVSVAETDLATGRAVPAAYPNYADWARQQDVFESLAASVTGPLLTTAGARPERLRSHRITADLFDVLGVRPAIGRALQPADERTNAQVALISDALWRRHFNADPAVAGRPMTFESGAYTIVGVMPPGFTYPIGPAALSAVDLWIPLSPTPQERARTGGRSYFFRVVGRMKPGVTLAQASARMQRIRDVLAADHPRWFADRGITVRPLKASIVGASSRAWMLMLLSAVAVVFLIACANVANLLLARASGRSREIGVRTAMGATRWQIVRGVVVESVVLALGGAAAGLLLASWGVDVLRATLPASLPRVWTVGVDLRVIGVAALAAVATGVLCGLVPALQMSRTDAAAALRGGGRGATAGGGRPRLRAVFLSAEVALAAVLLVGAGMFVSSFLRVVNRDLGFSTGGVLSVSVSPPRAGPVEDRMDALRVSMLEVLERVRALPDVESAALVAGGAPLSGSWASQPVEVAGRTFTDEDEAVVKQVTDEYFVAVGATILRGRGIGASDVLGAPGIVVLNDEAARRYFGDRDALGAQMAIDTEAPRTVVGVVRGMRLLGPETEVKPEAYVPYAQSGRQSVSASLVLRAARDPASVVPGMKDAIWAVMPGAVIPDPVTFDERFAALVAQRKLNMILVGIFAALALLIAAIGIYGMLAYLVEQRTREIGVRMALGAIPAAILRMILAHASLTIGAGLAVGFLAAIWLERLVMAFVFRGIPHDPLVYAGAAALLMALGLAAALVPARRAARVDPLVALRAE